MAQKCESCGILLDDNESLEFDGFCEDCAVFVDDSDTEDLTVDGEYQDEDEGEDDDSGDSILAE
jgi:hypothetical protein